MKLIRAFFFLPLVFLAGCTGGRVPEISWSLMHPTELDSVYMKRVIEESRLHPVDNFELCGGCNSGTDGSLDGLLYFEEYPLAAAAQNVEIVKSNRENLASIIRMSHAEGKKVWYWHREVLCNPGLVESIPGLIDANGEFDLLGEAYEKLLRYKIRKTFECVPDLDGIVLTLTEASFSALHNSRPDIYPPAEVVEKVGRIFAEELQKRGKRFILRSFGSIEEDYNAILAGAKALSKDFSFEVETKITPFDFNPFLPDNKFLVKSGKCTLGAECDVLGEFLGCGRMLPEHVDEIVRYVSYARKQKVDRYTIRLDRKYKSVFDVYPINLYAYEQAILHPEKTAAQIRREFYRARYPEGLADTLFTMSKDGMECVRKTEFIAGNMIFHWYPTTPDLRLLKAGGILGVFAPEGNLSRAAKQWAMLSFNDVPGRAAILEEKEAAVEIAARNVALLEEISSRLSDSDRTRLEEGWKVSLSEARSLSELCKVICAYFDDMEKRSPDAVSLSAAFASLRRNLDGETLLRPVQGLAERFVEEYPLELALRKQLDGRTSDYVLPGCVSDQNRVEHYMLGSFCHIEGSRPVAVVGNTVYPDCYLALGLKPSPEPVSIEIEGYGKCLVTVNGERHLIDLDAHESIYADASESGYEISMTKAQNEDYPMIVSVASVPFRTLIAEQVSKASSQAMLMYEQVRPLDTLLVDRTDRAGNFLPAKPFQWTSGFFPGTLWYLYRETGRGDLLDAASVLTARLAGQQHNVSTHDIGFMMNCSYGAALDATGDSTAVPVLVNSAESLCSRFSERTGCIRSWNARPGKDWDYIVIIDNMMNLELLMRAASLTGDGKFSRVARSHADNTMKNHFRPDGSCAHVVDYDSVTGKAKAQYTAQGYSDASSWTRGQGWAVYGYAAMYRWTGDRRYLKRAERTARFILGHPNTPEDGIVYWDYDAPVGPDTPRDASAAALIASAFIELSAVTKDADLGKAMRNYAGKVLVSLSGPTYFAGPGENACFILKHSTSNKPKDNYDTALVYADYYYVEALLRFKALLDDFPRNLD